MDLNIHRVKRAKKGDKKAKMELYTAYSAAMYNTGLRILNDRMEAEDAMHDAFLKAFTKLNDFTGKVSFGAWLKRIVINTCLDKLKKQKPELLNGEDQIVDNTEDNENAEELVLETRRVHTAISALPPGYRSIVSLHLIEGFDHEEIAQILGITSSTSRSQYTRAKQVLRKNLMNAENV